MVDGSAGIFTGLYWVATGKAPLEDLEDDQETVDIWGSPSQEDLPESNTEPARSAWGTGRGFGK